MMFRALTAWLAAPLLFSLAASAADMTRERLRVAAEVAFEEGRWTTPTDNCVLSYARQLLAQDPSDAVAANLKDRIVAEYLKRGDELLAKGQADLARTFFERALAVNPGTKEASDRIKALNRPRLPDRDPQAVAWDRLAAAFNAAEKASAYDAWAQFLAQYPATEFTSYAEKERTRLAQGKLVITAEPPAPAAAVSVDGKPAGATPLSLDAVAAGEHEVTVTRPFSTPATGKIAVPRGGEARFTARLEPADLLYEADADHHHALGSPCRGRLGLHRDRIEFKAQDGKHSAVFLWRDIVLLDLTNPRKLSFTSVRNRKSYTYVLVGEALSGDLISLVADLSRER